MDLYSRVEAAVTEATGRPAQLADARVLRGGCINDARLLRLTDGREFFLKSQRAPPAGMFAAEARALVLLRAPAIIRVPEPVVHGEDFLVLEALRLGPAGPHWQAHMGQRLALLHQATKHERYGFECDNYLGSTPQPNGWMDDWAAFWRERRLGWQLSLFARRADADDELLRLGGALLERVEDILGGVDEPPVLLHGDLWAGNAAADEHGEPVIFDPASYYGQREAEIAMMRLFGGFGPVCEAAYEEIWPLAADGERRILLYRLYHELNHLNLFGGGYYHSSLTTIRELLHDLP